MKARRIDREVAIGRHDGDREIPLADVQIDGLSPDEHDRVALRSEGHQGVEQHATCEHVLGDGSHGRRLQAASFCRIQASRAVASDVPRPGPVSRSATT